jgi:UDP-2-acetamido-3-amino-2,3-dideoxy-glucuronate N-acetyltransferase
MLILVLKNLLIGIKTMKNKICVIGAGQWGNNHIRNLNNLGALAGIVDSNSSRLASLRNDYPDVDFFSDVDNALKFDFDGFIVVTPAETHYNIAKKIIISGRHLLVEKPITIDLDDAIELNNLAKEYNVNLMVGHVLLFHPGIIKIKNMLDNGDLGELQYIYSNRLNLGKVRTP